MFALGFLLMLAEITLGGPCGPTTVAPDGAPHSEMGRELK